jgi:hypothetical protein
MPTVNVICHGMMLFVEQPFHIDILMPEVKEHEYKCGTVDPANPSLDHLIEVVPGVYALRGLPHVDVPAKFSCDDCKKALVLKGPRLNPVPEQARIWIQIPRPNGIKVFNTSSVNPPDIFGSVDPNCALNKVTSVSEVVVFHYCDVPNTKVSVLTEIGSKEYAGRVLSRDEVFNFCLYAQEYDARVTNHTAGTNSVMQLAGMAKHPDFKLTNIRTPKVDDGYRHWGIYKCQFLCLDDLDSKIDKQHRRYNLETADRTGCSSSLLARDA